MKKLVLFTFLFVFILVKSLIPSRDASAVPVFNPVVNEEEMNHFLRTWSEYLSDDVYNLTKDKMSLKNGKPSETLPYDVIIWLESRGWEADRFFYVEDRLSSAVKSAEIDYHVEKTIEILQSEKRITVNEDRRLSIDRMVEVQERNRNIEKVTPAEISMVNKNLPLIEDILNGKQYYRTFITVI